MGMTLEASGIIGPVLSLLFLHLVFTEGLLSAFLRFFFAVV
jgi:hypothetical protein